MTWNKTSNKDTKIIVLAMALNDHKKKFNELKSQVNSGKNASNNNFSNSLAGEKENNGKKKNKLKKPEW